MSNKYPRTFHLDFSPGATNDDKIASEEQINNLLGKLIIITEKVDGSNTCLEFESCFARTHSGPPTHESFDEFKALHSTIKHKIPLNMQIFGEWCFALHSIFYNELPGYFLLFGLREFDKWGSWEECEMWAEEIGVPTVPVLYNGIFNSMNELKNKVMELVVQKSCFGEEREGIVIRIAEAFDDKMFEYNVLKWVRDSHVKTNIHWRNQKLTKNLLKKRA
jgi:hypothetical protein